MNKKFSIVAALLIVALVGALPFIVNADSVITVDSTADDMDPGDGECTLREAIQNANNDSDSTSGDCAAGTGTDTIEFALTGGAPYTISPTSGYTITSPIIIDGTSQAGTVCTLVGGVRELQINVDASGFSGSDVFSFENGSSGSSISGFAIYNGSSSGVGISDNNITVSCNNIGTDTIGTAAYPNNQGGIDVQAGGTNSLIGGPNPGDGNLISGNEQAGIQLQNVSDVIVQGNWIGVDITGNAVLSNVGDGIGLNANPPSTSDGVQILDNVISGNGDENDVDENFVAGIDMGAGQDEVGAGRYLTNVTIQGNIIGLSADGTTAIPNEKDGIFVSAGVQGLLIGGPNPGDGNVLSGNGKDEDYASSGLVLWYGSDDITIQGNIIGLNPAGDTAIPNGYDGGNRGSGIRTGDTDRTRTTFDVLIGGDTAGERNIISGHDDGDGIAVDVDQVTVSGNYIGTDITGAVCIPNSRGVAITPESTNTVIGGSTSAEGNLIKCNTTDGIFAEGQSGNGPTRIQRNTVSGNGNGIMVLSEEAGSAGGAVTILQNSISGNENYGINILATDTSESYDQNPLDPGDEDEGPNDFINYPVISKTEQSGSDVIVSYALDVPVSGNPYHVEFFTNETEGVHSSGFGEGETYVDYDNVTIDNPGLQLFSKTLSGVDSGDGITATVTACTNPGCTTYGPTSEFSNSAPPGVDYGTASGSQTLLEDGGAAHLIGGSYLGACINGDSGDGNNTDADGPVQPGAFLGTGPCTDDRDGATFVDGETSMVEGGMGATELVAGGGLDDAVLSGSFTGTGYNVILVAVVNTGGPADLFVYAPALDGAPLFVSSPAAITAGVPQLLQDGIYVTFGSATGHGGSEVWAAPILPAAIGLENGYTTHGGSYEPGAAMLFAVEPSAVGYLNAWVDMNQDGDFSDVGEFVVENQVVIDDVNGVTMTAPSDDGTYNVRFRYTSYEPENPLPYGIAAGGEVEDYSFTVATPPDEPEPEPEDEGSTSGGSSGPRQPDPTPNPSPELPVIPQVPTAPQSPKPGETPPIFIPEGASTDSPYMDLLNPAVPDDIPVDPRSGEPIRNTRNDFQAIVDAMGVIALVGLVGSLPGIALRAVNILASYLFIKKRQRGVVYDSVTQQPLDPAYVSVIDAATGQEVASQITDMEGRFGFVLPQGTYKIVASKTNYRFPSDKARIASATDIYRDLYFGEAFTITDTKTVIAMNIPMDPVGTDWNQQEKKRMRPFKFLVDSLARLRPILIALFVIGVGLSLAAVIIDPLWWNIAVLVAYVILILLGFLGLGPIRAGMLRYRGKPLAGMMVRAYNASLNREIAHKVTGDNGAYYLLVPKAEYYVTVEEVTNGVSKKIFTSKPFSARNGIINKTFDIG